MIDNSKKTKVEKFSTWKVLKQFLKNIPVGETFLRKDMLCYIDKVKTKSKSYKGADTYIGLLTWIGFLKSTGPGKRKKLFDIPEDMKVAEIYYFLNKPSFFKWFITDKENFLMEKRKKKSNAKNKTY